MKTLPKRRRFRFILLFITPLLLLTSLISVFGLLIGLENTPLAFELAETSPQSIPHLIQYSLYRQSPPEGQVLGESIGAINGKTELLRQYLEWQGSPMVDSAGTFIEVAEKYDLPWTLLPSICGKESTFGKQVPYESYNCFGWGVYGSNVIKFKSWDDGIDTVGKGLREKYFDKGIDTVDEIEYSYTPPSANGTHHWRDGINFFMWQIENFGTLDKKR